MDTALIGQRLKEARKEKGLTLQDISDEIGLTKATIQRYETGAFQNLKLPVIEALANVLDVNPVWLMGKQASKRLPPPAKSFPDIMEIGKQRFPLFSGIACGEPIFMDSTIETYVSVTTDIKADFILRAKGDSMAPGIMDGDLVFIRSQPHVESGEIAAVAIGDDATLKRFYHYQDTGVVILRPDNPAFREMVYQGDQLEEVRILGKAVAFQRDVR